MTFDWLSVLLAVFLGYFLRGELLRQRTFDKRLAELADEIRTMHVALDSLVNAFTESDSGDSDAGLKQ